MAEVGYKKVRVSREMVRREQSFEEDVRDEASLVDIFSPFKIFTTITK